MSSFVLREASVLDESGSFSGPADIHVADGRVAAVGPRLTCAEAAEHDFSGLFVMPGMFDCHLHLAMSTLDLREALSTPVTQWALEAAGNARRTLAAGVTFVRDLAGLDAGIRDSIARGFVPGPRIQTSIVMLSQTGGHGDGFLPGPGWEMSPGYLMPDYPGRPPQVVNGVEEMRSAVRTLIRAGADWIKLATTGGLVSEHDHPLVADFTLEEIEICVAEARRKDRSVAVHAYGGQGLTDAVRAGSRSIEHGGFLTEEQAALMGERGCWLVPTLAAMRDCLRWASEDALSPAQCRKILDFGLELGGCVKVARAHGVRVACGTDYISRGQHGGNLEEAALMHRAGGLTVEEALLCATTWGAELCGVSGELGRIAPGFLFDAIVLDRDPGDLSLFFERGAVTGVFKGGDPLVPHVRITREA
jgi:imidazolonepropionase-like amidohydrolase